MTQTTTATLDPSRTEALAERLVQIINDSGLALMISVGHRTGLFDAMSQLDPATPKQIADAAGLNERYVREWLGGMTTGRIVEHDPDAGTYWLPAEHAALLTRAASPENLAVTTQWFAVMAGVEDQIVEAFSHGKGVPYSSYHRFHEVMAEESDQTVVAVLVDRILPLVPGVVEQLERGIDVVEVGCGQGRALIHLAQRFPASRFVGIDFSDEAIDAGRREAQNHGLTNIALRVGDAAAFDESQQYDLALAFDAIHDQADPAAVLANVHRALRPGGTFLMQDITGHSHHHQNMDEPLAPLLYAISTFHCMSVSLAQGGPGLGAAWGEELAVQMLNEAGFESVQVNKLEHDIINNYYVMRKR